MDELEAAAGAEFEDVGNWKRAWYFPRRGADMAAAVHRECRTVRDVAGVFDAATLGQLEVVGPDAAQVLNIPYSKSPDPLQTGHNRYGITPRGAGFIYGVRLCWR